MTNMTDAELVNRDERIARVLSTEIEELRQRTADLRAEAARCERQARDMELAANREEWWKLGGVISSDDIESLCQVSPTNLLG